MKVRVGFTMLGALSLAAVPFASHAGPNQAVDACVSSFIEAYIPKDRVVNVRRSSSTPSPLAARNSRRDKYTIALTAVGARSGKQLAQAKCVASARGEVIVLDSPADDNYVANADFTVAVNR